MLHGRGGNTNWSKEETENPLEKYLAPSPDEGNGSHANRRFRYARRLQFSEAPDASRAPPGRGGTSLLRQSAACMSQERGVSDATLSSGRKLISRPSLHCGHRIPAKRRLASVRQPAIGHRWRCASAERHRQDSGSIVRRAPRLGRDSDAVLQRRQGQNEGADRSADNG